MALNTRIIIPDGEDFSVVIRLRNKRTGDPLDLTNLTRIETQLTARDRSTLSFLNKPVGPIAAAYTYAGVLYSAVTGGAASNNVALVFDGVLNIGAVVAAWNTANPSNEVQVPTGTDTTVVPPAGSFNLEGGYDLYTPVTIFGDPLLGKIKIVLIQSDTQNLRIGANQSMKLIMDFVPGGRKIGNYQSRIDVE